MTTPTAATSSSSHPSLLEPLETSDELRISGDHPHPTIHAQHSSVRNRLIDTFYNSGHDALRKRAWKLRDCCRHPTLRTKSNGDLYYSPCRCRDRLCPLCARIASRITSQRITAAIENWDQCRHLTLTLRANDAPLIEQLDGLVGSFRRLRQRRWWRDRVRAGIGTVEITFNAETGRWHPHLHLLLDGAYLPQREVSQQWSEVTDDSFIVHITAVHSRAEATKYIAKYVSKPSDVVQLDRPRAVELALALVGRRTLIAFGAAHGVRLPVRTKGTDHTGSQHVVSLAAIRVAANDGQVFAGWALHRLHADKNPAAKILDPHGLYTDRGPPAIDLVRNLTLLELLSDCDEYCRTLEPPQRYCPKPKKPPPEPWLFD